MFEKLKFLASGMWEFLRPLIRIFLGGIGPILAKSARAAVEAAAQKTLTGTQKRDDAYGAILGDLEGAGFKLGADFAESTINAAIEAAVQGLK